MAFKDFYLKLKAFRLRRFVLGDRKSKKREPEIAKKPSWMMPISHGYHVVEDQSSNDSDSDSVVVQREQIGEIEVWFFGVFDAQIGDGVTKYMQSHLFDSKPKESQIRKRSKETMKKAYIGARAKIREAQKADKTLLVGSASVIVINGEKLVVANMGEYKAVVCRDGVAHQISRSHQQTTTRRWTRRLFSGNAAHNKQPQGLELAFGTEKIDSDTEFVIIASCGIWQVMRNQEAASLIRHIEDPQEAAECLAIEAVNRLSKSKISCVVIRFD
ncbi:PP2C domain-containing protein [Cephalotus follicularis]|uniref:PP2C domain-containing protein n=1 Tax=Cephalotus follicularis TaxID=3775 RepID=A0A1Q3CH22_CEPFO|nr:PP2C domain-containing protein [Cephalotus follicularis]